MKVIVLGNGLLGGEIIKQTAWDYISRGMGDFDICYPKTYEDSLMEYDVVVNCVAYTNTYIENRTENWDVNYKAVDQLIDYCNKNNKKLIHISTDYVYTNSKENAKETDVPVHLNTWYGYTKLLGDALVQLRSKDYLICRLSHKPNPFPYDNVWMDVRTNCDYVDVIASMVIKLIKNNESGVFNVGTEEKSIYDLAIKTNKNVYPTLAPSHVPHNVTMCLDKLKSTI